MQLLAKLAQHVVAATGRFERISALKRRTGTAVGVALTIAVSMWALTLSVEGLSVQQVRATMAQLIP